MTTAIGMSELTVLDVWERGRSSDAAERAEIIYGAGGGSAEAELEVRSLPIGEVDAHVLAIREVMFGPRIEGIVDCDSCGEHLELTFDSSQIRAEVGARGAFELTTKDPDCKISFRPPTTADLHAAATCAGIAEARRVLVGRVVVAAELSGKPIETDALPEPILGELGRQIAAADPQSDVRLTTTCPACGAECQARFDVVSFFWRELEAAGQDLLIDVHALAAAYGWSEPQILSLPVGRRRVYLELIDG